ncbi:ParA family protein [Corynebacterium cystitidis]|uniref:ParA family protein n=1 Tax=Corynebacterium cystitidis TaxID=35757 RepID=UPI00211DBFCC|nr:ParA family protein [Corynebacterium cystitidis]
MLPTHDVTIIDCPPGNSQIVDAAIRAADHVIVPIRPSSIEVDRMWDRLALTEGTPTTVLLNSVIFNTRSVDELREALDEEDINAFDTVTPHDTVTPQREAIKQAFGHNPANLCAQRLLESVFLLIGKRDSGVWKVWVWG